MANFPSETELYSTYYARILMIVRKSRSVQEADVEEVANDAMWRVMKNLRDGKFREESSLTTYVIGITRNTIRNYIQKDVREKTLKEKAVQEMPRSIRPDTDSPDRELIRQELWEQFERVAWKLGPEHRQVIIHFFQDELGVNEIAAKMGIPAQKVSNLKKYALTKLEELMNESLVK